MIDVVVTVVVEVVVVVQSVLGVAIKLRDSGDRGAPSDGREHARCSAGRHRCRSGAPLRRGADGPVVGVVLVSVEAIDAAVTVARSAEWSLVIGAVLAVKVGGTAGTVWVFGVVLVTVEVIDSEATVKMLAADEVPRWSAR